MKRILLSTYFLLFLSLSLSADDATEKPPLPERSAWSTGA